MTFETGLILREERYLSEMVDNLINMQTINILAPYIDYLPEFLPIKFNVSTKVFRGGSRGRVQGVRTPP